MEVNRMEEGSRSEKRQRLTQLFNDLFEKRRKILSPKAFQKRLAEHIQTTSGFITHIRKGMEWFKLERVELVCDFLNVPSSYFELADPQLTIEENERMVVRVMEFREDVVRGTLAKR